MRNQLRKCVLVAPFGAALWFGIPASAGDDVPFSASYSGTYHMEFGAGSVPGSSRLEFHGGGNATHLGNSAVDGASDMVPDEAHPGCTSVANDDVRLTAANGDELHLVNTGLDCLEVDPDGSFHVRGTGVMTIVGGTGRFAGASGVGTWTVDAPVTIFTLTGVDGTFDIQFEGSVDY